MTYILKQLDEDTDIISVVDKFNTPRLTVPFSNKTNNPPSEIVKGTKIIACSEAHNTVVYLAEIDDIRPKKLPGKLVFMFDVKNLSTKFGELWSNYKIDYKSIVKKYNRIFEKNIRLGRFQKSKIVEVDEHFFNYMVDEIKDVIHN